MDDKSPRRARTSIINNDGTEYEVGYGKPPKHGQFQPGQSGNPHGRPTKAMAIQKGLPEKNEERMKSVIQAEAYRTISVRDGDRLVDIPVIHAIVRSIALSAAKGHQRSQRMFVDLLQGVERENKEFYEEWLKTAIEYKVGWTEELKRRERTGETGQEPLPHPDSIRIDFVTGLVEVLGPMCEEDKPKWEQLHEEKADCDSVIAMVEKRLIESPNNKILKRVLAKARRERAKIVRLLPD